MSGGHGPSTDNKFVALLIAVLALALAFSENFGNDARTRALGNNIEASNLWSFFQAKTVRQTILRTHADEMETVVPGIADPALKASASKRVEDWRATAQRYETEPETQEGRRELVARAKKAETERDKAFAKHVKMELAAAMLHVGIVLASTMIITGVMLFAYAAVALGIVGVGFIVLGLVAPTLTIAQVLALIGIG